MIIAKKNTAYYLSFPAIDSASPGSFKTGLSPVDTAYYKDGAGAWTSLAIADTATEIGSTGVYEIDLTASEMNHDKVLIKFAVSGMADDAYQFDLRAQITDDLATSSALATAQSDLDTLTGTDGVTLATSQPNYAPATAAALTTAQNDLDTLTGTDGVTLATAQPNYAPATAAALAIVDGIVDNILVDTGTTLPATLTTIEGKVDTVDANVDLVLADTGTDGVVLSTTTQNAIADAILDRDMSTGTDSGSTTVRTPRQALRFLRNKWDLSGTTLTVYKEDDATSSWSGTVTTNASAEPVTGSNPAGGS